MTNECNIWNSWEYEWNKIYEKETDLIRKYIHFGDLLSNVLGPIKNKILYNADVYRKKSTR